MEIDLDVFSETNMLWQSFPEEFSQENDDLLTPISLPLPDIEPPQPVESLPRFEEKPVVLVCTCDRNRVPTYYCEWHVEGHDQKIVPSYHLKMLAESKDMKVEDLCWRHERPKNLRYCYSKKKWIPMTQKSPQKSIQKNKNKKN